MMELIQIFLEIQTSGDVVDDTSPQLGGDLDTNSFMIDI